MNTRHTVLCLLLLLCTSWSLAVAQSHEGVIFVTPERVRPAIDASDLPATQGSGEVEFNDATNTIKVTITHDIPADQTLDTSAVHLHLGVADDNNAGEVIILLSESGASPIEGSGVVPDENVDDVLQGRTYVTIHTQRLPNGELAGQVIVPSAGQDGPSHQGAVPLTAEEADSNSTATGNVALAFRDLTHTLTVTMQQNVPGATAAHIHGPANPGDDAPPLLTVALTGTTTVALTDDQVDWLLQEKLYINVHSTQHPKGAIRGQLRVVATGDVDEDGVDPSHIAHVLMIEDDVVPPVGTGEDYQGVFELVFFEETGTLFYTLASLTVPNPTAIHLHGPARSTAKGPVMFDITNNLPSGQLDLDDDQVRWLLTRECYFQVHAPEPFQDGIIRGQVLMIETGAEISGSQDEANDDDDFDTSDFAEVELLPENIRPNPVPSQNSGVAKFYLDSEEAELQWKISTSIPTENITAIHIHGPSDSEGTAPPVQELLGLKGAVRLTPQTMSYLMANLTYINVHTTLFTDGELRGHITMEEGDGGSSSNAGAIVGIIFAILAAVALLAVIGFLVYKKKIKGGKTSSSSSKYQPTRSTETDYVRASDAPMRSFGGAPTSDVGAPLSDSYRPPEQLV
mmetsp:Transcript_14166/g.36156  ORF Transcript_14166/g.36156 Transcript_14166/m.36156 type:complete len:627 (-) Transcript_14166:84-1964(-)|eukprot:CAMPEP_0174240992 /NCGR_PEP_ID=MMETSP0417-20130205/21372_1 /TAXON_ID=242541 /ORGANISM="Mayorella sp, Strain BSH-02190019" /LENGTH=626 /DNA_ID=CAMNT_0015320173 /DNA_START=169 /DNA_END=2049 /DNA_ORIENTATION=-